MVVEEPTTAGYMPVLPPEDSAPPMLQWQLPSTQSNLAVLVAVGADLAEEEAAEGCMPLEGRQKDFCSCRSLAV